jgi:hypothetical protein
LTADPSVGGRSLIRRLVGAELSFGIGRLATAASTAAGRGRLRRVDVLGRGCRPMWRRGK